MAGLTSIASTAMQALSFANTVIGGIDSYKDSGREYKQMQQKNALELKNLQNKTAYEKAQMRLDAEQDDAERREKLRRAIAKQRAQYGASGIDADSGSAAAYLLGIENLSDEQRAEREALLAMKSSILEENYNSMKRVNTLELTQLKERNKLKKPQSVLQSLTSIF